jgi:hypothetical protein
MPVSTHTVAVGVFSTQAQAQSAVNELRNRGFREEQVGFAAREGQEVEGARTVEQSGSAAAEGAAVGLTAGAGVGALWGLGILAGMLPAIGPAIAGGTLAALLSSAAAGAAVAGIAGALIGWGIPEEDARFYEEELRSGRTIVTVHADERFEEAAEVLRRHGGYDYGNRTLHPEEHARGYSAMPPTTTDADTVPEHRLPR